MRAHIHHRDSNVWVELTQDGLNILQNHIKSLRGKQRRISTGDFRDGEYYVFKMQQFMFIFGDYSHHHGQILFTDNIIHITRPA